MKVLIFVKTEKKLMLIENGKTRTNRVQKCCNGKFLKIGGWMDGSRSCFM